MIAEHETITWEGSTGFLASSLSKNDGFLHFHPEFEIMLNIKSNGTRLIGDSVEIFDKYYMTLIAGNIPHRWNHYSQEGQYIADHSIMCHFKKESIGDNLLNQPELAGVKELLSDAEKGVVFSRETAMEAAKYLQQMTKSRGMEKVISFFNLLRIMADDERRQPIVGENYRVQFDGEGVNRISEVYTYIRENYNRPMTLREVARIVKMRPGSFGKYFKRVTGTGFVDYINQVRTNKACYELRETEDNVNNIASECGFGSITNFNRQFRKHTGTTPLEYRSQFN